MNTAIQPSATSATTIVISAGAANTSRAPAQGGILEGLNPVVYSPINPIILFIIQAGTILIFCRLLHYPLAWLRQPRVIAEVIGGILLGPSVMGRIPGFTDAIFAPAGMPVLTVVADVGLLLFLFIVGLEVDVRWFTANWKPAVSVGLAGMALPFGLGCALSVGLYHSFKDEPGTLPVAYPTFMLFIGVATAITAFPVLCRILTELQLLSTPVGAVVLSAGVGNDVVGWILLALSVTLVNAGNGITALWVLLTAVGWALFLVFVVRPAFYMMLRRTRSLEEGPSQSIVAITILMMLTSAFFTGVIGIHPIFGAFMAGLICPHEGGFAIALTEKVEDLVSVFFLPLYFALSGLSTNLGLLNTAVAWGYVFAAIGVAFSGKFIGGSLAAKLNGLVWRESFTIGALMSCKGLVELIVLNIGLQAKLLSQRVFTIFVVMALVTTFATTPLTTALYPPWYQRKLEAWRRGEIEWDGTPIRDPSPGFDYEVMQKIAPLGIRRLMVYLRLDAMPTLLAFVALFGGERTNAVAKKHPSLGHESVKVENMSPSGKKKSTVEVHGVRLVELGDRGSAVMKVSERDDFALLDPVVNTFKVLAQLYSLVISGEVAIVPENAFADALISRTTEETPDLLLLPWSDTGGLGEYSNNLLEGLPSDVATNAYQSFISRVLGDRTSDIAIFVNNGFSGALQPRPSALTRTVSGRSGRSTSKDQTTFPLISQCNHHFFVPFLGGSDDRAAARLVLQIAENSGVTATLMHFKFNTPITAKPMPKHEESSTMTRFSAIDDDAFFASIQRALPADFEQRVVFETVTYDSYSLDFIIKKARDDLSLSSHTGRDAIVVARQSADLQSQRGTSCLGPLAEAILDSDVRASLIVMQGSDKSLG